MRRKKRGRRNNGTAFGLLPSLVGELRARRWWCVRTDASRHGAANPPLGVFPFGRYGSAAVKRRR